VEKVNPDVVVRDKDGKPYSVRYEQVNAMLFNEFLKEHRTVQEQMAIIAQLKSTIDKQEATNARQQKQIEVLTAGLQKVSARLELANPQRKRSTTTISNTVTTLSRMICQNHPHSFAKGGGFGDDAHIC
jgi:hypothetical protein